MSSAAARAAMVTVHLLLVVLVAEIKGAKIILSIIYYFLPSKDSISWEVGAETKLLPDSAFGNSLCTN